MLKRLLHILFLLTGICGFAQDPDLGLLKDLNAREYPHWDQAMEYTSFSVYPAMVAVPGSMLITGLATKNKELQRSALKTCIGLGLNTLVTQGLKLGVARQRPYAAYPSEIVKRTDTGPYSFPSGHTSTAFSLATSASLTTRKWYVAVPAYLYAGTIGYSRMRLGAHYPSDVAIGALIGVGSSWLVWKADRWLNKPKPASRPGD